MSATDDVLARMTAKLDNAPDEVAPYLLLCMAILSKDAPDVAAFIMDRADEALEESGP